MTSLERTITAPATPADVACTHCGLPVPPGLLTDGDRQFCCNGCATVYDIIHQHGLDGYYRMRAATDAEPRAAAGSDRDYAALDHPAYAAQHIRQAEDGARTTELMLDGMHCAACVWLVENISRIQPDVHARVDYARRLVRLEWRGTRPLSQIARALDRLGYPAQPAHGRRTRAGRHRTDRRFMIQLAIAGVCAGNGMLLAFALYSGLFDTMAPEFERLFRWSSMFFGWVAMIWPGRLFLKNAWAAIRTRTPHLDVPVALGLLAALAAGTVNVFLGRGEIYFDSLTVLVFLLLGGRWLQHHQQRWVADAMDMLLALTPGTAFRIRNPRDDTADPPVSDEVPLEALAHDDVVAVPAGGTFPVDGRIRRGSSELDLSLMTGETHPVPAGPGDTVIAGATNLTGPLEVTVTATGTETRLGQLLQLVENLHQRRSPWIRLADRLAGAFVVTVLGLAALTLLLWWPLGPKLAFDHAVALVIVACPCALSLATPLTVAVALGRAARTGILIKGGDVLEQLSRPGLVLFDKTGTLTTGTPRLAHWSGDDDIRPLVVAIERCASHPLARAWVDAWDDDTGQPPVADFRQSPRGGVRGHVRGHDVIVGQRAYVAAECDATLPVVDRPGCTIVHVVVDNRARGWAAFRDEPRPDAPAVLERLRAAGWRIGVASGDQPAVVEPLAAELGIEPHATWSGQTPEDKLALVQQQRAAGPVVMIGDGVNDTAALSAATVGIAVRGGAEASLIAADVYLRQPGLAPVLELFRGSNRARRAIQRGLAVSVGYNLVAVGFAVAGLISPLVAAVLMPVSSVSVVALAVAAATFRLAQPTPGEDQACP